MTLARERAAAAKGITPLDYMLSVLHDEANDKLERFAAAQAAAPYVHPRLAAVNVSADVTHHYVAEVPAVALTADEWSRQEVGPEVGPSAGHSEKPTIN